MLFASSKPHLCIERIDTKRCCGETATPFASRSLHLPTVVALCSHACQVHLLLLGLDIGTFHNRASVLPVRHLHVGCLDSTSCVVLGKFSLCAAILEELVPRLSTTGYKKHNTCHHQTLRSDLHPYFSYASRSLSERFDDDGGVFCPTSREGNHATNNEIFTVYCEDSACRSIDSAPSRRGCTVWTKGWHLGRFSAIAGKAYVSHKSSWRLKLVCNATTSV